MSKLTDKRLEQLERILKRSDNEIDADCARAISELLGRRSFDRWQEKLEKERHARWLANPDGPQAA
jgi:hypothetical protein